MCENCKKEKQVKEEFKKYEGIKGAHKIYKPLGDKPYEDLSGEKFGRLTAVEAVGRNKKGMVLWLCECECSNKVITISYSLKNLDCKSCGCIVDENCRRFDDLTGRTFGRLKVIKRVENKGNKIYYECLCSCGNTVIVRGSHLKQGLIQSCKCLNKERVHQKSFKDLTGKRIGRLLITGIAEESSAENGHNTLYYATCDCGNKIKIRSSQLSGKRATQSCGCLHKEVTSEARLDDLTGKKFGELTVIKRVENTPGGKLDTFALALAGASLK